MSNQTLNIEMELGDFDPADLSDHVKKVIEENLSEFRDYCERLIDNGDARTEIVSDSYELEHFEFDPQTLEGDIAFSFDSDTYYGCRDMDGYANHESEHALPFNVELEKNKIIFDEITLPPAWRPDEAMEDYD